jgi:quercetin dioxygenase-like cupin family protein
MGIVKASETTVTPLGPARSRYLAHTERLMVVVVDFHDGPAIAPDAPHAHPHEQVTYVAEGELILVMGGEKTRLSAGDLFTVPPDVPHAVQTLSPHVRLIDSFNPIREEFLKP